MELRSNRAVLDGVHAIKEASYFVDPSQAGHIMRILREMYENPVRAVIREYGANAQDAHRQAGIQDRPFEVWAPNAMSPVLRIRDFGPGLPHESADKQDVVHLLLGFGSSGEHKRTGPAASSQIGGFGIGCKAAFAVTDSFTYHVYHNKRHRTYLCYLDEHDKGCSKLVFDKAAPDDPSGIEVEIPVAKEQLPLFNTELATTFSFFTPLPVVHGGKTTVITDQPLLESTQEFNVTVPGTTLSLPWKIYSKQTGLPGVSGYETCVVMGGIAYPVRLATLFQSASDQKTNPRDWLRKFVTVITAPIGTFDLAPSRETLQYSKHTIQLLERVLSELVNRCVPARVQPQIDIQPDRYAAFDTWVALSNESLTTSRTFPALLSTVKDSAPETPVPVHPTARRQPDLGGVQNDAEFKISFVFKDEPQRVTDFAFIPQSFLDTHQLRIHVLRASPERRRFRSGAKGGTRFVPVRGRWNDFLSELHTAEGALSAAPKVRSAVIAAHPWPKTMWPRLAGSSELLMRSDGTTFSTQLSVDWRAAYHVFYVQHRDHGPGYYFRVFVLRPQDDNIRNNSIHVFLGTTPDPKHAPAYIRHHMTRGADAPARYGAVDAVWITGPAPGLKAFADTYQWLLSKQEVTVMQDVTWVPEKKPTVTAATTPAASGLPARKSSAKSSCITGWHICTADLPPVSGVLGKKLAGTQYFTVGYRKEVTDMGDISHQQNPSNIRALWQVVMSTPGKKDSPELFYLQQGHESSIRSRFPNITWKPAKDALRDKLLTLFHGPQSSSPTGGFTAATYVSLTTPLVCGRSCGSYARSIDRILNPAHPSFVSTGLNAGALTAVRAAITQIVDPSWTQHTWPAGSPVSGLLRAIEAAFPSTMRDWYHTLTNTLHGSVASRFWEQNLEPVLGDLFLGDYETVPVSPAIRKQVVTLVQPIITAAASFLDVVKVLPAAEHNPQALGIIQSWCSKHTLW